MKKMDIILNNGDFYYYIDVTKENKKSIYGVNMYDDILRIEKSTLKVFKNKEFIGIVKNYEVFDNSSIENILKDIDNNIKELKVEKKDNGLKKILDNVFTGNDLLVTLMNN